MSQRRRTMQGALLIWLAASLLEATIVIAQEGVLPLFAFLGSAVNYGILGLLAIPAWHLCAWLSQAPRPKWQLGAFYTLLLTVMLTLWQISYQAFFRWRLGPGVSSPIEAAGLWFLFGAAITCGLVIAGIVLAQTSRALRHQAERSAQLKLLAQEAELRSLEAQLRPHFFFNVLNSIYSLIETRPEEAQRMVDQVAQLMRRTLEAAEEDLVPLEWELDSARTYLAIEEIRLGSRLEVTYEVDDALAEIAVPPLLLQPVVENAVKHGIAPSTQRGRIEVGARREGEQVILTVRDSGPGLADGSEADDAAPEDTGRGLEITRNRLRTLYPDQHTLSLRNLQPTGLEVAIHIPGLTLEGASGHVG